MLVRNTSSYPIFEKIYELAKANDKAGLYELIRQGHHIDITGGHLIYPVSRLAAEGNDAAVDLLIHDFGARKEYALLGYAQANNELKVKEYLATGCQNATAVVGYAMGEWSEKVKEFIKDKDNPDILDLTYMGLACQLYAANNSHEKLQELNHPKIIMNVVQGYALAKNHVQVNKLATSPLLLERALAGYAQAGDHEHVKSLIAKGVDPIHALQGYILSGFWNEAEAIVENSDSKKKEEYLNILLTFYAQTNYTLGVNKILKSKDMEPQMFAVALTNYAQGGHVKEANALMNEYGLSCNFAIIGYAASGMHQEVEKLLKKNGNGYGAAVIGYANANHLVSPEGILNVFTHITDSVIKKNLYSMIKKTRLDGESHKNTQVCNAIVDTKMLKRMYHLSEKRANFSNENAFMEYTKFYLSTALPVKQTFKKYYQTTGLLFKNHAVKNLAENCKQATNKSALIQTLENAKDALKDIKATHIVEEQLVRLKR